MVRDELFAERLRREAQAAALEAGTLELVRELDWAVRNKLAAAWTDAVQGLGTVEANRLDRLVTARIQRSVGERLMAMDMTISDAGSSVLLSLVEAQHEVLADTAAAVEGLDPEVIFTPVGEDTEVWQTAGGHYVAASAIQDAHVRFLADVNNIFEAHNMAYRLNALSRLVPVTSNALHDAVVAPTLHLLHGHPRFAGTEAAFQKALIEIRNRDAGDAITDAGTALQAALTAVGCSGNTLGDLVKSARKQGLIRGADNPLADAVLAAVHWVAAQRNLGEAHYADSDAAISDAWMVVHVVGALIVRLADAESSNAGGSAS